MIFRVVGGCSNVVRVVFVLLAEMVKGVGRLVVW